MKTSLKYREGLAEARRIVVKVGTRVLVDRTGHPNMRRMSALVKGLASLNRSGYEVALVTSGAIGAGMEALGMKSRPTALPDLQMAAAVGQSRLMTRYDKLFSAEGCIVGQVLLTRDDFLHKIRLTNARRTIANLLRNRVIPIINENDVVADDEIRADLTLGDNDRLSALLVKLIQADLLIVLSTVDGVRRPLTSGATVRIPYLESIDRNTFKLVTGGRNELAKGGMASKLQSAQMVSRIGVGVVIADGRKTGIIDEIIQGKDVGTFIVPSV
ncbi:MAG: glutamate 5-kinase [bacterium]